MMKFILLTMLCFNTTMTFAQKQIASGIKHTDKGLILDSIFPIDNIASIKVTNYSGTRTLTKKELTDIKGLLKQAKYAGGLTIKPGHITLDIELKDNTVLKSGFVYASTGSIHFDGGIDKFKRRLIGSFYLPTDLNFDNYK